MYKSLAYMYVFNHIKNLNEAIHVINHITSGVELTQTVYIEFAHSKQHHACTPRHALLIHTLIIILYN